MERQVRDQTIATILAITLALGIVGAWRVWQERQPRRNPVVPAVWRHEMLKPVIILLASTQIVAGVVSRDIATNDFETEFKAFVAEASSVLQGQNCSQAGVIAYTPADNPNVVRGVAEGVDEPKKQ